MDIETFTRQIGTVTSYIAAKALDKNLEADLNAVFPPRSDEVKAIFDACQQAIVTGWMCNREAAGIKYGRVIKAGPATQGFSVDVVDMDSIIGPHHRHPNGEIDLMMPLTPGASFDNHGAGWVVYGPDSAHKPTVKDGRALVLYLLPDGAIDFT